MNYQFNMFAYIWQVMCFSMFLLLYIKVKRVLLYLTETTTIDQLKKHNYYDPLTIPLYVIVVE